MLQANKADQMVWIDDTGKEVDYSVGMAWNSLRGRNLKVPLLHVVWFTHAIPRHAFFVWLIMLEKLKTQDKVILWDKNQNSNSPSLCIFCSKVEDSHKHLFFECDFSKICGSKQESLRKCSLFLKFGKIMPYIFVSLTGFQEVDLE